MIPSIPDKIYKLLTLIGIVLIGYSFISNLELEKKYFEKIDKQNDLILESKILDLEFQDKKDDIIDYSNEIALKYGVDKIITLDNNGNLICNYNLKGNKNELKAVKLIYEKFKEYKNDFRKIKIQNIKLENYSKYLDDEEKLKKQYEEKYYIVDIIGTMFLFIGLIKWLFDETKDDKVKKPFIERIYLACQSCGKIFSASRKYGTEKDGSLSNCYCKECYKKGKFTNKELTKEEIINTAKEEIKNENFILRYFILKNLNRLERWNPNKYTFD